MHWLSTAFSVYVAHPTRGAGGRWWGGPGSDLGEIGLFGAIAAAAKHKNCHQKGCWRLGHAHPKHGFPTCRRHYGHELRV